MPGLRSWWNNSRSGAGIAESIEKDTKIVINWVIFLKKKVRQRILMQPGCNQDASRGPHETLLVPSDRSRAKGSRVWRLNEHINQWAR